MRTRGEFSPASETEVQERYEALRPAAETVVREATTAMGFDRAEFEERVTPEVRSRVHDALFASTLEITVGTRSEFDDWAADRDADVVLLGSENVDHVAWHDPPVGDCVAATFQDEEDAAVETLRRQVFGRVYRGVV
jgi:hypothetical protein